MEVGSAAGAVVPPLMQLGFVGVAFVALGWFALSSIRRERTITDLERARADRAETAQDELQRAFRDEVIPVLVRCTDAMTRMTEEFSAALRDRRGS